MFFSENIVAIDRKPYNNYLHGDFLKRNFYIVKDKKAEPISSTFIKESYANNQEDKNSKNGFSKNCGYGN